MQRPPLGELFVQLRLLTPDEVSAVLKRMQKGETGRFGLTALELGLVDHEGLAKALAHQFGLRFVTSERIQRLSIADETMKLIPASLMRDHLMVPTFMDPDSRVLSLLTSDPTDLPSLRAAQEHASAQRLRLFVGPEPAVADLIDRIVPKGNTPESQDETEVLSEPQTLSLSQDLARPSAIVLETDLERLGALRALEELEQTGVDFVHDPEQVPSQVAAASMWHEPVHSPAQAPTNSPPSHWISMDPGSMLASHFAIQLAAASSDVVQRGGAATIVTL